MITSFIVGIVLGLVFWFKIRKLTKTITVINRRLNDHLEDDFRLD